jgi:hypothetical protein
MGKLIAVASVAAALAVAGTAVAAGPVRSEAVFDFPDPEVYTECDDFDVVLSNMHIERQALTWYEGETPILERWHAYWSGIFTNSNTGKTGEFSGHLTLEFDLVTDNLSLTGLIRQVKVESQPAFVATGVDVTDVDENILFQAGRSLEAWEEGLCGAMG